MNYVNVYFETINSLPFFLPLIFAGILGMIVGSFLNVVIFRESTEENVGGRSHCQKCEYKLQWFDLIPVLSWLSLKGRCRKCDKKISIQYPIVELATGIIFAALYHYSFQFTFYPSIAAVIFLWNAVIFSILIAIFVFDLKHKIIPNKWSYTFAILSLIQALWLIPFGEIFGVYKNTESIFDAFAGIIFFAPFFALWFFSSGRWIGLGDGKLVIGIGWYLGFVRGLSAIILGFWIGAVVAILMMLIQRLNRDSQNITMKTEIPFGPFLIIGTLIQFFYPIDVMGISIFFN
jgi:leader peptidase (prepilin peptidase)/N-methyltransferase